MYPKNYTTGDEDGNCYPDTREQHFPSNGEVSKKKSSKISRENDIRNYYRNKKDKKIHPLVEFIIYGDIDEMPIDSSLNSKYDSYNDLDEEQKLRVQIASVIQAYFDGKLHKNGYLFDEKLHKKGDLIR